MNTLELERVIETFWPRSSNLRFNGVFARNEIKFEKNGVYVVNTEEKTGYGQHWFCFLRKPQLCELFDSYGDWTVKNVDLSAIIGAKTKLIYNTTRLQSDNFATCGIYCIFYCLESAKNRSLSNIVDSFSISRQILELNDSEIIRKRCQLLECGNKLNNSVGAKQCCRSYSEVTTATPKLGK
jgi:hypothetical protein